MARKTSTGAKDGLAAIADELYLLPPESFIPARDAHVSALRADGQKPLATQVSALRKPTVAAWAVNLLVRSRREQVEQFAKLGPELAQAQRGLDGEALSALSVKRQRVVHALVREARELAAGAGHPITGSAGYEVETMLHAALADPQIAERVLAARLLKPERYAGMGPEPDAAAPRLRSVSPDERARPAKGETAAAKAARLRERRRAEDAAVKAESELAEAEHRHTEAADDLATAEQERADLDAHIATLREQLADAERRTAEVELDRRRLGKVAERAKMHLVRVREQASAARDAVRRASDRD